MRTRVLFCIFVLLLMLRLGYAQDNRPLGDVARQNRATRTRAAADETSAPSRGKIDPAKEADIRRLLDVAGTKALIEQSMSGTEKNIRPLLLGSLPPGEYREELINLFFAKFHSRLDMQQLLDLIVPVYDKHLSHEEIKSLLQFYQTPLGQKTLTVLPKIAAEAREAGEKWGADMGRKCMLDVLDEHPELAKAMQEANATAQPH